MKHLLIVAAMCFLGVSQALALSPNTDVLKASAKPKSGTASAPT